MKLIRKLVTGLMILLVVLGSSPLVVFANVTYNPLEEFPDQTKRGWPKQNDNNVATTLPEPPAIANTVNMSHIFHYPELIYTGEEDDDGVYWETTSDRPWETKKLAKNRAYVTDSDSSVGVITRDARWQSGIMWSNEQNKIVLSEHFRMVAYVYLGERTQHDRDYFKNGDVRLGGADGITFTMHNDNKQPGDVTVRAKDENTGEVKYKLASGSLKNTGMNAYGALGNGLGVYGSNFSANVSSDDNNMVDFWRGVENGITLEFDTFFNDNDTTQHSDNDLTYHIIPEKWKDNVRYGDEGHEDTKYGHIAINLLNDFKNNRANRNEEPNRTTNKHKVKLSLGWDGEVSEKTDPYKWKMSNWPNTKPSTNLADGKWHRLEVEWTPDLETNTGKLNYKIYKQGHEGSRNISDIEELRFDGTDVLDYTIEIGSDDPTYEYSLQNVFGVEDLNNSVYWGFSGSTGGFMNNQAVQILQLPVSYYTAELNKVNQDRNSVSGAQFKIEKKNENDDWIVQQFYDPKTSKYVETLETGSQKKEVEVYKGVFQSEGKIKLTQLTKGTYRWKEVAPPEGYQRNQEQQYYPNEDGFDVNNQNPTVTTTAVNKKLYQLELTKTDADTDQPLNGVPFIFSKTENDKQYYLKVNADTNVFEWTEVKTDAVEKPFLTGKSYLLGQDGTVTEQIGEADKIIVKYFPDAPNLSWEEVEVPKGYDSSGTLTGDFTPSTDNGYVYSATQTNSRLYQVSLEKKASDTNKALPGAVFSLEQHDGSKWKPVGDNKTTDENGNITISNLKAGTYRWNEITAPAGYKIKQQYHPFEVKYDSNLEIDDTDTNNYIFKTTEVTNDPKSKYGGISITKNVLNETESIKNKEYEVEVSIKDKDNKDITTEFVYTSDKGLSNTVKNNGVIKIKNGEIITIKDLPEGAKVFIKELVPEGFTLLEDVSTLKDVIVADQIVKLNLVNKYTPTGSFRFTGNKKLLGRDIKDYRFTFTVIRDGNVVQKVNNDETGAILFKDIVLTKDDIGKTYKYQIVENDDKQQGIVYDQKVYEIEVSVTDDGKGNIIAEFTDPDITFSNAHKEMPATGFNYNFYIPVLILIVVTLTLFNDKGRISKEIW